MRRGEEKNRNRCSLVGKDKERKSDAIEVTDKSNLGERTGKLRIVLKKQRSKLKGDQMPQHVHSSLSQES